MRALSALLAGTLLFSCSTKPPTVSEARTSYYVVFSEGSVDVYQKKLSCGDTDYTVLLDKRIDNDVIVPEGYVMLQRDISRKGHEQEVIGMSVNEKLDADGLTDVFLAKEENGSYVVTGPYIKLSEEHCDTIDQNPVR